MATARPTLLELAAYPPQRSKALNASLFAIDRQTGGLTPPLRLACDGWHAESAAEQLAEWFSDETGRAWVVPRLFDRPNVAAVLLPCKGLPFQSVIVVHPVGWTDAQLIARLSTAINSFDAASISN